MRTATAMARLVRANPVDSRNVAKEGRSPRAQVALNRIFAAPADDPSVNPSRGTRSALPTRPFLLAPAIAGVVVLAVAAALMVSHLPRESPRSGPPGTTAAGTAQREPLGLEGRSFATTLPRSAYADSRGNRYAPSSPPTTSAGASTMVHTLLVPGSTHLLAQVVDADIVAYGIISEVSSTPSSGPGDVGYTTFALERAEILLGRGNSATSAGEPGASEAVSVGERLLFRAVGFGVEDVGHRGGLAEGDQVVFIGTRRYPLGESSLPGFWLLLGDYSAYRGDDGLFTRLTQVHDDPSGNSFTLPELREMLAPYGE